MTSNKALQDTQPQTGVNLSGNGLNTPTEAISGVGEADNPFANKRIMLAFIDIYLRLGKIEKELKVKSASMQILLLVIWLYERDRAPVSQYQMTKHCGNGHSTVVVYRRCKMMARMGIIERVGMSKLGSPVYVPCRWPLEVISKYFSVVEVDYIMSDLYRLPLVA